jgi:hypothetical protein
VRHVRRTQFDGGHGADRHMQFVRRHDAQLRIMNLPPPLMTDRRDLTASGFAGILDGMDYRQWPGTDQHDEHESQSKRVLPGCCL